jgi:hypothetical protein
MEFPTITKIASKAFNAHLNLDTGIVNVSQGFHNFNMELTKVRENVYNIEWNIPSLDTVFNIGIWTEGKKVTEYDGVFELPKEAIELLEENGFDCSQVKD